MFIENVIDESRPYIVYFHYVGSALFYIGSGVLSRAFDHGSARRNEAWNKFSDGKKVTVEIRHYCRGRSEARRLEYGEIKKLRPIANLPYDPDLVFETKTEVRTTVVGHVRRVAGDPWEGNICLAEPGGHRTSLKLIAGYLGIPLAEASLAVATGILTSSGHILTRIPIPKYSLPPMPGVPLGDSS